MQQDGDAVDELHERLSKAVVGMEKGFRASEKSFNALKELRKENKLSAAGIEAMKTLCESIKARLHRTHRYTICYKTHTDITSNVL